MNVAPPTNRPRRARNARGHGLDILSPRLKASKNQDAPQGIPTHHKGQRAPGIATGRASVDGACVASGLRAAPPTDRPRAPQADRPRCAREPERVRGAA